MSQSCNLPGEVDRPRPGSAAAIDAARDPFWDALRGVAIVGVILLHAAVSRATGVVAVDEWNAHYSVAVCQVVSFSVPLFVFISGYFNARTTCATRSDYVHVLWRRGARVLGPYLFWSCLLLAYAGYRANRYSAVGVLFKLATGQAAYPYYFMVMLLQCYALLPVLLWGARRYPRRFLAAVGVLNLAWLVVLYGLRARSSPIAAFPYYALPFISWLPFFALGLVVGQRSDQWRDATRRHARLIRGAWLVALGLSLGEGFLADSFLGADWGASQIKLSSFVYSVLTVFLFLGLNLSRGAWIRGASVVGLLSFGIYLVHAPLLSVVLRLAANDRVPTLLRTQPIPHLAAACITVGLSAAVVRMGLATRLRTLNRYVFGFAA